MRLVVIAWLAIAVGSCGFTSRSDEFKCETTTDCTGGRECHDNWCVLPTSIADARVSGPDANLSIDAPPGTVDAAVVVADAQVADASQCPAACTSCQGDLCVIDCNDANGCFGGVTCPAGMRCEVTCSGDSACNGDVDCTQATECAITCNATNTCQGRLDCGTGPCAITCTGTNSCAGKIDCDAACTCTTSCTGTNTCTDGRPNCPGGGGTCRDLDECVQIPPGQCNTCP